MSEPGSTETRRNPATKISLNTQTGPEFWPGRGTSSFSPRRFYGAGMWWVSLFLFLLTLVTTTVFGFALVESFSRGQPFDLDRLVAAYTRLAHHDPALWSGLYFSVPLLLILLAHEFGHYFLCARWEVDASPPYFLPSPMLFGTFGAFIRIRSPIYTRESLFDIGISGPVAGFVVLLPFLMAGLWMSHVSPGIASQSPFVFGTPLAIRLLELVRFPGVAPGAIVLHPMAMAAWAGLLATAFNLLPMGQLDGGHILYAVSGQRGHRLISTGLIIVLALLGFLYWPWWFWAAVMFFFGRRHPLVYDQTPVSKGRFILAVVALGLFVLSISVVPVRTS